MSNGSEEFEAHEEESHEDVHEVEEHDAEGGINNLPDLLLFLQANGDRLWLEFEPPKSNGFSIIKKIEPNELRFILLENGRFNLYVEVLGNTPYNYAGVVSILKQDGIGTILPHDSEKPESLWDITEMPQVVILLTGEYYAPDVFRTAVS